MDVDSDRPAVQRAFLCCFSLFPPFHFHFASVIPAFKPSTLACTSDSLVRVSRRVNSAPFTPLRPEQHCFLTIANVMQPQLIACRSRKRGVHTHDATHDGCPPCTTPCECTLFLSKANDMCHERDAKRRRT